MLITKDYTFSTGATILASEHNTNFDTLFNWANGNVDNANIKSGANISLAKLSLNDDITMTGDWNFTSAATTDDMLTLTGSSLTTGSALKVYSNSASTSERNLVEIINDHADADDTVCLLIQQDGDDYAIDCGATGKIRGDLSDSTFPSGSIVQIVNTQSQTAESLTVTKGIPADNTTPLWDEGAEYTALATTITPKSATNKLLIEVIVCTRANAGNGGNVHAWLFQDPTGTDACKAGIISSHAYDTTVGSGHVLVLKYYMTAGTTSATTFKIRMGLTNGTSSVPLNQGIGGSTFGDTLISSMTITEIKA